VNPSLEALPRFRADVAAIYAEYLINVRGDALKAEVKFRAAIAAAPNIGQYRVNLVNFLLAIGRPDDAAHEIATLRSVSRNAVSERRLTIMEADVDRLRSHISAN
jgi:Tfp pilus assembly protein PilF